MQWRSSRSKNGPLCTWRTPSTATCAFALKVRNSHGEVFEFDYIDQCYKSIYKVLIAPVGNVLCSTGGTADIFKLGCGVGSVKGDGCFTFQVWSYDPSDHEEMWMVSKGKFPPQLLGAESRSSFPQFLKENQGPPAACSYVITETVEESGRIK